MNKAKIKLSIFVALAFLGLIYLIIIPFIYASNYGEGSYGADLYGSGVDAIAPVINGTVNNTNPKRFDVINATFNLTDETGLSIGNITFNLSGPNSYKFSFALSGTNAQISQNITVNLTRGAVINITGYGIDSGGNVKQNSTIIEVANTLPTAPNLAFPFEQILTNRTPKFNWTNSTDIDNDPLQYQIIIKRISCASLQSCDTNLINITNINEPNSTLTQILDVDSVYNWTVFVNDSVSGYNISSNISNFTVNSLIAISLPISSVDFGQKFVGDIDNTTNSIPPPLQVQNDGNIFVNLTIRGNQSLWERDYAQLNTSYFQYLASNSTELDSFNGSGSVTDFANVTSYFSTLMRQLNWSDARDLANISLYIRVPTDEPSGTKITGLVIQGEQS